MEGYSVDVPERHSNGTVDPFKVQAETRSPAYSDWLELHEDDAVRALRAAIETT